MSGESGAKQSEIEQLRDRLEEIDQLSMRDIWCELRQEHGILYSIVAFPGIFMILVALSAEIKNRIDEIQKVQKRERWRQEVRDDGG